MWADGVVKGLNIGEEISRSGAAGIIAPQVNQLAFQAAEKVFGHGVVIRVALAGHAGHGRLRRHIGRPGRCEKSAQGRAAHGVRPCPARPESAGYRCGWKRHSLPPF